MLREVKYTISPIFLFLLCVNTSLHAGLYDWGTTGVNDMGRVEKVLQFTENPNSSHARAGDYSEPWNGDGSWIVYSVDDGLGTYGLYKIRSDGTELTQLTDNVVGGTNGSFSNASFASDGRIYFDRLDVVNGGYDIYRIDSDGALKNLSAAHSGVSDKCVRPSPDGGSVAYLDNMNYRLKVARNDGTFPVTLSGTENIYEPQHDWSPDSQWLAFKGRESGQEWVYTVKSDGSLPPTALTNPPFSPYGTNIHRWPTWSPDGETIAYIWLAYDSVSGPFYYNLRVINAKDGSDEQSLDSASTVAPGWERIDGPPSWSPDGRWIAYNKTFNSGGTYSATFIVPSDGSSEPIQLTIAYRDYKSFWSPDGSRILFEDSGSATSRDGDGRKDLLMLRMRGSYGKFPWPMFLPAITSGNN